MHQHMLYIDSIYIVDVHIYIYYIIYTTLNGMSLEAYTSNIMQSIQVKCGVDGLKPGH